MYSNLTLAHYFRIDRNIYFYKKFEISIQIIKGRKERGNQEDLTRISQNNEAFSFQY